jgi:hypothetical protein
MYGNGRKKGSEKGREKQSSQSWHSRVFTNYLCSSTREPPSNRSRQCFLNSIGLANHEANVVVVDEYQVGPLDELRASHFLGGPFRVALTLKPSDHLTYEESADGPIIKLLDLNVIINSLFVPQIIGLTG